MTQSLRKLNELAKILRQRRIQKGALTLSSPEVRFKLENDSQDPLDVEMKQLSDTNALVEEFMLLANIAVARKIQQRFSETSVLRYADLDPQIDRSAYTLIRRHPVPPPERFEPLIRAAALKGIVIDPSTSKTLSDSLEKAQVLVSGLPYFMLCLIVLTRWRTIRISTD